MREIVLDTETTGLDPFGGHRIVEIGCVELFNRFPTGRTFHCYLNPERDVPREAFEVHGLSAEFLADKPCFAELRAALLEFLGDAPLVIHNAAFDLGFLNAELERTGHPPLSRERHLDTLMLARRKHPGGSNRLDDLCVRYGIDNSRRTKHGALLDAEILAEVYLELIAERQAQLGLAQEADDRTSAAGMAYAVRPRPTPLMPRLTPEEFGAHAVFIASLGPAAIWSHYADTRPFAADRGRGPSLPRADKELAAESVSAA